MLVLKRFYVMRNWHIVYQSISITPGTEPVIQQKDLLRRIGKTKVIFYSKMECRFVRIPNLL